MKFKHNGQWYDIPTGTTNYVDLANKPQINGVTLSGNKTSLDLGIITKAVNDLENYYLKTETYTKEEVNTIVSSIQRVKIEIVDELPTEDIDPLTIYFVPKTPSTHDSYDEFMYINNQWEHIGSTEVDLSNYYTKTEVDLLFDDLGTASELNQTSFGDPDGVYLEASSVSVNKTGGIVSDAQTEFDYILGNLGGLKFVNITQAEYDALPTPRDPQTVFIIVS